MIPFINKDIYVLGNSPELPKQLQHVQIPGDAYVIRFNKAYFNLNGIKCDLCIFNDILYEKHKSKLNENCVCISWLDPLINNAYDFMKINDEEFTTGMLALFWISKFNKFYKSVNIFGFNMVEPGEKAHFFDDETPSPASHKFKGHNAVNERHILRVFSQNPSLKMHLYV